MREYNLVILGAGGIGKSAIVTRYVQGVFLDNYDPTIEDSYRKQTTINDRNYSLEILDTAGIEQFTAMRELYIKNSEGFILAYSVTSRASFEELEALRNQVASIKDNHNIPIVLVGNMCDLEGDRQVSRAEGKALAHRWGNIPYFETSAKQSLNIDEIFVALVGLLVRRDSAIDSSFRNSSIYTHSTAESRTHQLSMKRSFAKLKTKGKSMRRLVSVASLKPNLKQRASQFFGANAGASSRPPSVVPSVVPSVGADLGLDAPVEIPTVSSKHKSKCVVM